MKKCIWILLCLTLCLGLLLMAGCKAKEIKDETRETSGPEGQTTAQDGQTEEETDLDATGSGAEGYTVNAEGEGDPLDAITNTTQSSGSSETAESNQSDEEDPQEITVSTGSAAGTEDPEEITVSTGSAAVEEDPEENIVASGPVIEADDPEDPESTEETANWEINFEDLLG